jgi:hypothetical protein
MRKTKIITVIAGTPIQVHSDHVLCTNLIVQPKVSSSGGIVYLILGVKPADTPASANGIELTAAPTAPSTAFSYTIPDRFSGERIDLSETYIDGAHAGDKVLVSWWEIPA